MGGKQFVELLVENGIGVHKAEFDLLEMGEDEASDEA
jgi:hypothetical protein